MSSYAFFVQTCWEEHKKKHPELQSTFQSFPRSAQRGERPCLLKRKENLKTGQRWTRPRYEREMKTYIPPKGKQKRSSRIPMHPRGLCWPSSHSILNITPKSKEDIGDVAKKLGEMWNNTAADKQPYKKKAAKLKKKYEKDTAAYQAKGKTYAAKKGVVKAEKKNKKKKEYEEDEEDEEEDEEGGNE